MRYDVDIELLYHSSTAYPATMAGKVVNLSKTGFLANIDGFGFVCKECAVEIFFSDEAGPEAVEMPVEHLWMFSKEGKQYHGFRFLDLSEEQGGVLKGFLERL